MGIRTLAFSCPGCYKCDMFRHSSKTCRWPSWACFGLVAAVLGLGACASGPVRVSTVSEGPQGGVYLARVSQTAFQASHPVLLDESLVRRLLRGILVTPRQGSVTTFIFGSPEPARAFSDQDAAYLAPLIVKALGRATPRHVVEFEVLHPTAKGPVATAATVYAHGASLYLTMTQYRYGLERPEQEGGDSADRESPDFTGLYQREVRFAPSTAVIPPPDDAPRLSGQGYLAPLVISYERLAGTPEPEAATRPAAAVSMPEAAPALPRASGPPPNELERLKEENRELRQRLEEQAAALKALQQKAPENEPTRKKRRP
jgi:hypothetical protein